MTVQTYRVRLSYVLWITCVLLYILADDIHTHVDDVSVDVDEVRANRVSDEPEYLLAYDVVHQMHQLGEDVFSRGICNTDLMVGHGVPVYADSSPSERFCALCKHILRGECQNCSESGQPVHCMKLSGQWESMGVQSVALCSALYSAGSTASFSVDILEAICAALDIRTGDVSNRRLAMLCMLKAYVTKLETSTTDGSDNSSYEGVVASMLVHFERMNKTLLQKSLTAHGLVFERKTSVDDLRRIIIDHLSSAGCRCDGVLTSPACGEVRAEHENQGRGGDLESYILSVIAAKARKRPLCRVLRKRGIHYEEDDSLRRLRGRLKRYIHSMNKGKGRAEYMQGYRERLVEAERDRVKDIRAHWPQLVGSELKEKLLSMFREDTSSDALRTFTCACCAAAKNVTERKHLSAHDLPLDLFRPCENWAQPLDVPVDVEFEARREVPLPTLDGELDGLLLDPQGVEKAEDGSPTLVLCKKCASTLRQHKLPPLALANRTFLGPIPPELAELTAVEESMVALCRAKCWILQLREEEKKTDRRNVLPQMFKPKLPGVQRGVKGHIIIQPQHPDCIESILPLRMEDAAKPICVIFVGASRPSKEWLQKHAKPLCVRRDKVHAALLWLKRNNPLYHDVHVDEQRIQDLPEDDIIPVEPELVARSEAQDMLMSRYDNVDPNTEDEVIDNELRERDILDKDGDMLYTSQDTASSRKPAYESVVITDVDGNAPPDKLRAAAIRHFKRGGGHLEMPHDNLPQNEYFNPVLFPKVYPTLFPYGIGGFEDKRRTGKLSMKHHAKHLFSLADRRFQQHYSFMFTVFNVLQRREVMLHTSLKVKRENFSRVAKDLQDVSAEAVARVCQKLEAKDAGNGGTVQYDVEEQKVFKLMREVKFVSHNVPASSAARLNMRNEIRGLMAHLGLPSFFVTINPADVFNPVVKFLAGENIDVDNLLPEQVPDPAEQSIMIARDPAAAAKFFNIMMKSFIKNLLGYANPQLESGILGVVNGYYGCVEAQGRGSLHCHMLVWVEGGMNPNEIRQRAVERGDSEFAQRLIKFLDDCISTAIPLKPDAPEPRLQCWKYNHPPGPCVIRDIVSSAEEQSLSAEVKTIARGHDLNRLVTKCQRHEHGFTCYKYCKKGEPLRCRFDLEEGHVRSDSYFDQVTGELCLRCLDGVVNNFNETILRAIRCNMDIKFIGSGDSAKGVLYYITDYIAKAQLKTHVAYAALELAVKKLDQMELQKDDVRMRSRRLLRKCIFSILSNQELSAQQVMSYNLELEDHFTSHTFRQLYWASAEDHLNDLMPSPECYTRPPKNRHGDIDGTSDDADMTVESGDDPADESDDILRNHDRNQDDAESNSEDEDEYLGDDLPDEVTILANQGSGQAVPHSSQLQDYIYRPPELEKMCYWDFIAQTNKIPLKVSGEMDDVDGDDDTEDVEPNPTRTIDNDTSLSQDVGIRSLLGDTSRKRPTFRFISPHIELHKKVLKIIHPRYRRVVVPIGPPIPRRDQPELFERYSRAMLLLFSPWRNPDHLRAGSERWSDAFQTFDCEAIDRAKAVMNNMQLIHECKENRDHQLRTGNHHKRPRGLGANVNTTRRVRSANDAPDSETEDVLDHLLTVDEKHSQKRTFVDRETDECVSYASQYDVFRLARAADNSQITSDSVSAGLTEKVLDTDYEDEWSLTYDQRKDAWKLKQRQAAVESSSGASVENNEHHAEVRVLDAEEDMEPREENTPYTVTPRIVPGTRREHLERYVNDTINKWTLNVEQARAFRLVAMHSLSSGSEPLRLLINGPGGTGKSRVINALREFFASTEQVRRFRLASFTGIAAKNIAGMTLHAGLPMGGRRARQGASAHQDLIAMWEGVDYLFIDEVSMISCPMLAQISDALNRAKGKEDATGFGGVNIIFAGDFAQLPPIGGCRLYTHIDVQDEHWATKYYGQSTVAGKILWNSVTTVVTLSQIMRQRGSDNDRFVQLLSRL